MDNSSGLIIREDVYSVIMPIVVAILGWFLPFLSEKFSKEKQWKHAKEKSSRERYSRFCMWVIIIGVLILFLYTILEYILKSLFRIEILALITKIGYFIFSTITYVYLAKKAKANVCFKKEYKNKARMEFIFSKIPFVLSWALWAFIFFENVYFISRIVSISTILYEIYFGFVLDDNRKFKYKYATFHFYDNKTINNIATENIYQKGNWIIVGEEDDKKEYRFRIKDVEYVEYQNEENRN